MMVKREKLKMIVANIKSLIEINEFLEETEQNDYLREQVEIAERLLATGAENIEI